MAHCNSHTLSRPTFKARSWKLPNINPLLVISYFLLLFIWAFIEQGQPTKAPSLYPEVTVNEAQAVVEGSHAHAKKEFKNLNQAEAKKMVTALLLMNVLKDLQKTK